MSVTVTCPNCAMSLAAAEADVGKQGKCSRCGTVFTIEPPRTFAAPPPAAQFMPAAAAPVWADVPLGVIRVGDGLARGFSVLHSNLGVFVLIALCFLGITFAVAIAGQIPCLGFLVAIANAIFLQPALTCGFYRACLKQHDGTEATVGDLFAEFSQWTDILLLALATIGISIAACMPGLILVGAAVVPLIVAGAQNQPVPEPSLPVLIAGMVLFFVSALLVSMALMFAYPALVDRRKGAADALKTSWRLMTSNPLGTFGAMLLAALMGFLGVLACCVGILYAQPAIQCMFAAIYRTATPPRAWYDAWMGGPPTWSAPPAWPSGPAGPPAPLPTPPQGGAAP